MSELKWNRNILLTAEGSFGPGIQLSDLVGDIETLIPSALSNSNLITALLTFSLLLLTSALFIDVPLSSFLFTVLFSLL